MYVIELKSTIYITLCYSSWIHCWALKYWTYRALMGNAIVAPVYWLLGGLHDLKTCVLGACAVCSFHRKPLDLQWHMKWLNIHMLHYLFLNFLRLEPSLIIQLTSTIQEFPRNKGKRLLWRNCWLILSSEGNNSLLYVCLFKIHVSL